MSFYRVARLDAARVELGKRGGGQWGGIAATPGMLIRYIKRQHPTRRGLLEAAFKAQWGVAWEGLTEEELESMDKYSVMMVEILCGGDRRGLDTNEPERGGNAFLITHRLVFGNPPKPAAEEERRLVLEKKSEPAVEEARGENFW